MTGTLLHIVAAEDLILSDAGDAHLLSDDILTDDLLDNPSIDGEVDAEKLLDSSAPTVTESSESTATEDNTEEKKEIDLTEKKSEEVGTEDAQRSRAIRFGLPLTGEVLGSDSSKAARAKR
uniref:Uncharacterized protein n=1 Tax=Caenorhabditis japonica TaxID=281687 RepID=A0A8R1E7I6_CAEJA